MKRRVNGPVLTSKFLVVLDHSVLNGGRRRSFITSASYSIFYFAISSRVVRRVTERRTAPIEVSDCSDECIMLKVEKSFLDVSSFFIRWL